MFYVLWHKEVPRYQIVRCVLAEEWLLAQHPRDRHVGKGSPGSFQ